MSPVAAARVEVYAALLRQKGLTAADVARELGVARQHAHRLLTGARAAGAHVTTLDRVLALGVADDGRPLYAVGELLPDGSVELVQAGATQPLCSDRAAAEALAESLGGDACAVPVWPTYAWERLVGVYAAWGERAQERSVFVLDELPPEAVTEVRATLEKALELRRGARGPDSAHEVAQRAARERG
jgi:transcriptional regulator with XRE-family HTH domain